MKQFLFVVIFLAFPGVAYSQLVINEFVTETPSDWVELKVTEESDSIDVSSLLVTMYYGTNEKLADEPVILKGSDDPSTPYDDRFLVVYLSDTTGVDETDIAGDVNGNGIREVYCSNYSSSLWNTDGVVSIDSDDDPDNGGIVDFVSYYNGDGSMNNTIKGYIQKASAHGAWQIGDGEDVSLCTDGGLDSSQSISRKTTDTNSKDDFEITGYQTPGRENIFSSSAVISNHIEVLSPKKQVIIPGDPVRGIGSLSFLLHETSDIKVSIFTSTGLFIVSPYQSEDVTPGIYSVKWKPSVYGTGLYISVIEVSAKSGRFTRKVVYFIINGRGK